MTDSNQDSQRPMAPVHEQNVPKQQPARDFPHLPLVRQFSADKDGRVYRGSDKGGRDE